MNADKVCVSLVQFLDWLSSGECVLVDRARALAIVVSCMA